MAGKVSNTIIVDCQVLQTKAWTRGMGRYLISLLMGIYQMTEHPRVVLIFNENLKFPLERQQLLKKVVPDADHFYLPFGEGLSDRVERTNSRLLDEFVKKQELEGAVFVNGSIFSFDYQPAFPASTYNTCIFYDMIPLKRWDIFYNYFPEREYFKRFKYLYTCQTIFAISAAVRQDLIKMLDFSPEKVVNISGANIPQFLRDENGHDTTQSRKGYRYVLLVGGDSPHKNMLRAIRAFDEFNAEFGDTFKLVITSFYSEKNKQRMRSLSPNIELTGQISDQELSSLYKDAEIVFFPSLDEGLGLPVLEAVEYGRKLACSSIPVFQEISKSAFYYFDPVNITDMSRALTDAITGKEWGQKEALYKSINDKFTWRSSADRLVSALPGAENSHHPQPSARPLSIIVEQAGDMATLREVSRLVNMHGSINGITIYMDKLSDRNKKATDVPLMFDCFIPSRDIPDATYKALKTDSRIILTNKSSLTLMIGLAVNGQFIGNSKQVDHAVANLLKRMRPKQIELVSQRVSKDVIERLAG